MRRKASTKQIAGRIAIITGIVIILAMILPVGFWWFALAAALISLGIWIIRSC